jgi:hypothetical protein
MKTSTAWVILAVAVGVFAFFAYRPQTPLVIGAVLPFSGIASTSAQASRIGFDLARSDFGSSSVTILFGDSQLSSTTGATETERLIHEGANILYSSFSVVTNGVSPVSIEKQIPLLYDSCNCGFAQDNPYAFQLYFDPRKECRVIAQHFKSLGIAKGAFIAQDVPYAKYCYEAMEDVLGKGNVLIELESSDGFRAYKDLLPWFASQGAEFVVSVPAVMSFPQLFVANDATSNLPIFCFVEACLTKSVITRTPKTAFANVTAFALRVDADFKERVLRDHPDFSNEQILSSARAYDVVAYAVEAAAHCSRASSACLVAQLEKIQLASPKVVANGFGDDHVLDYDTAYVQSDGTSLSPVSFPN